MCHPFGKGPGQHIIGDWKIEKSKKERTRGAQGSLEISAKEAIYAHMHKRDL